MIGVDEAQADVLRHARALPPSSVDLGQALGLVLAEQITSDLDSPPRDKALVDGYAVVAEDLRAGPVELTVLEEVTAGLVPTLDVRPGAATRIMTGAPTPRGADAVVMVERTELVSGRDNAVRVTDPALAAGANIMRRATSMRQGDLLLSPGRLIRPIEIGLLAEVGRTRVMAHPRPRVAVLSTGNELVPPDQMPGPGAIRNSNGPMLAALVTRAGGLAVDLGICRDEERDLRERMRAGLESDVLVLSGGVSAGVLDLVPHCLASLGVRCVFHHVQLKPGKPTWFGVAAGESGGDKLVFGLPGNPVSSLVCFELFVRPAVAKVGGRLSPLASPRTAELACPHKQRGNRPTYFPAILVETPEGIARVTPTDWRGSADQRGVSEANCLVYFPAGDHQYQAGDRVRTWLL